MRMPDFEVLGEPREDVRNGTPISIFEFRGDVTDFRRVLIVSDGWNVLLDTPTYPSDWRTMPIERLFESLMQNQSTHRDRG